MDNNNEELILPNNIINPDLSRREVKEQIKEDGLYMPTNVQKHDYPRIPKLLTPEEQAIKSVKRKVGTPEEEYTKARSNPNFAGGQSVTDKSISSHQKGKSKFTKALMYIALIASLIATLHSNYESNKKVESGEGYYYSSGSFRTYIEGEGRLK